MSSVPFRARNSSFTVFPLLRASRRSLLALPAKPVMGLPGHPVSALVVFALFGAPLVRMIGGESADTAFVPLRTTRARLAQNIASAPGTGGLRPGPGCKTPPQMESASRSLPSRSRGNPARSSAWWQADGMVCIPHNEEGREAGEEVEVILF